MSKVKGFKLRQQIGNLQGQDLKAIARFYSEHPAHFINDCMLTYDPRLKGVKAIPFELFPRQREYVEFLKEAYDNRDDAVIEKCRDVGASWLNAGFTVWLFCFRPGSSVLWGANKLDLVDKMGDMNSLLERIDFILRTLPITMKPTYTRNYCKIINHLNGCQVTGAGGENIGRGGRSSITFVDEAGFIEGIERVDASLSMNTDCQIWLSTPNGQNLFYKKRMSPAFKVFTFQWFEDPRKDQAWYDKQKNKLSPTIFAQEVLIDYSGSVENICIPKKWIDSAVNLDIEASGKIIVGLDVADEGGDLNAIVARKGNVFYPDIETWAEGDTNQTALKAFKKCRDINAQVLNYDSIGVGAGVKASVNTLMSSDKKPAFIVSGIKIGEQPSDGSFMQTNEECKDMFLNLKAEVWWLARMMFKETYNYVNGEDNVNMDYVISIPNNPDLVNELSAPKYKFSEAGKIQIERKADMKKRGIDSPNIADAFMLSLCGVRGDGFNALMS